MWCLLNWRVELLLVLSRHVVLLPVLLLSHWLRSIADARLRELLLLVWLLVHFLLTSGATVLLSLHLRLLGHAHLLLLLLHVLVLLVVHELTVVQRLRILLIGVLTRKVRPRGTRSLLPRVWLLCRSRHLLLKDMLQLSPASDRFNYLFGVVKTFELLNKALVYLGQV